MNRDEMIKWLKDNTIREQWGDNRQLPKTCGWRFSDSRLHDCNYRSVLRVITPSSESGIFFENVFEQPVFINGAEYWLKDSSGYGEATKVRYELGTNAFYEVGKPYGKKAPASDFGKHFTVELVSEPVLTTESDEFLTCLRNIYGNPNATENEILDDYRKCTVKCGPTTESKPKPSASLYNRIVKVLGERDVPIGGEDHLVGQVKVDSHKAKILDKVVEEFNIPVGGNIIQWLRNRTQNQSTVNRTTPRNKYDREILPGVHVDVYDVLEAFNPQSKAIDHAVKKLLCPGQRGVKDRITDLEEAMSSICREIERLGEWGEK